MTSKTTIDAGQILQTAEKKSLQENQLDNTLWRSDTDFAWA